MVIWLLAAFSPFITDAQPTLPDVAAAANNGIVILSWNCQYTGIKSITVLRSSDSVANYATIGKVKKLDKGTQAFVDGHPAPGKNFYRLIILFRSGLSWSSNHTSIYVAPVSSNDKKLPPNDSLQRYITTSDTARRNQVQTAQTRPQVKKDILAVDPEDDVPDDDDDAPPTPATAADSKKKVYISFNMDTVNTGTKPAVIQDNPVNNYKVTVTFEDPNDVVPTFIRSMYVYTDNATGHVKMNLPDDVATHHYSVKFYDGQNRMITEVPRINSAQIIFDKRNFQHKGTYKFVLRRDVVELETGYVQVNP